MAHVTSASYAHVRLTVTDIARSVAFYDDVFGWDKAVDAREHAGEPGVEDDPERFYGGVVYAMPGGTLFGLRPVGSEPFRADVTGLDHVSFAVDSRAGLDAAAAAFDAAGVRHGEVVELADAGIAILSFQDPDDVNLELTAPLS